MQKNQENNDISSNDDEKSLLVNNGEKDTDACLPARKILNLLISRNLIREILLCIALSNYSSFCSGLIATKGGDPRIRKILGVLIFHESAEILIDGVWGSFSLSLLVNSIINYNRYPSEYENTNWLK